MSTDVKIQKEKNTENIRLNFWLSNKQILLIFFLF